MKNKNEPKRLISYVLSSDKGLAPNITGNICTLTVCKPVVRRITRPGEDWIVGFSTAEHGRNRVIYAMIPDETLSYSEYFDDPRFQCKKPDHDPAGDNFFRWEKGGYVLPFNQAAHYGSASKIQRDLNAPLSVIGHTFWYFGETAPELDMALSHTSLHLPDRSRRGHRVETDPSVIADFVQWIDQYEYGVHGRPRDVALKF